MELLVSLAPLHVLDIIYLKNLFLTSLIIINIMPDLPPPLFLARVF
jgi:hypothetical protein